MAELYQRFDILPEFRDFTFDQSNPVKRGKLAKNIEGKFDSWLANLHTGAETLRKTLLEKGYEVLESNDVLCGVHGSILLGSSPTKNCKRDFYSIAEQFQLPYRSGPCYFTAKKQRQTRTRETTPKNPVAGLTLTLYSIRE